MARVPEERARALGVAEEPVAVDDEALVPVGEEGVGPPAVSSVAAFCWYMLRRAEKLGFASFSLSLSLPPDNTTRARSLIGDVGALHSPRAVTEGLLGTKGLAGVGWATDGAAEEADGLLATEELDRGNCGTADLRVPARARGERNDDSGTTTGLLLLLSALDLSFTTTAFLELRGPDRREGGATAEEEEGAAPFLLLAGTDGTTFLFAP